MIKKFLIVIIALIAFGEIILRVNGYKPPHIDDNYEWNGTMWLLENVDLNSVGYRDEEHTQDNLENNYRIYFIGNSYTFGWFIDKIEDTYPKLIESRLNSVDGRKVEVINGAMWGFRLKQEFERYMLEGRNYHPDLVVFGLMPYEGNVSNKYFRPADIFLPKIIRTSRLYYFLVGHNLQKWADKKNFEYYKNIYQNKNSLEWKSFESYISQLSHETKKAGSQLAILVFPFIHEANPNVDYDFYEYNARLSELGKKYGIIIIDPIDEYKKYPDKRNLVLNPIDAHPTVELNKIFAKAFIKQFDPGKIDQQKNIETKNIELSSSKGIGNDLRIVSVKNKSGVPLIVTQSKFGDSQELPVPTAMNKYAAIYPDKFIGHTFQEPELNYYTYSHNGSTIEIPKTLYGYEIAGVNQISALSFKNSKSSMVTPLSIFKTKNGFVINLNRNPNFDLFKVTLSIMAGQTIVDKDNFVDIASPKILKNIQKNESAEMVMPYTGEIYSLPHKVEKPNLIKSFIKSNLGLLESITNSGFFSLTDKSGKLKPIAKNFIGKSKNDYKTYVFIDGKQTEVKSFLINKNSIHLALNKKIKVGQIVELPAWFVYDFTKDGPLTITTEN